MRQFFFYLSHTVTMWLFVLVTVLIVFRSEGEFHSIMLLGTFLGTTALALGRLHFAVEVWESIWMPRANANDTWEVGSSTGRLIRLGALLAVIDAVITGALLGIYYSIIHDHVIVESTWLGVTLVVLALGIAMPVMVWFMHRNFPAGVEE